MELCPKHDKDNGMNGGICGKTYICKDVIYDDWDKARIGCYCYECVKESGKGDEIMEEICKVYEKHGINNLLIK
jgi:hypothetical protein